MHRAIIAILVVVIALGGGAGIYAASQTVKTTASVDVMVWKAVDSGTLYLSTRPGGGRWTTHSDPVDPSTLTPGGRFYQTDPITVTVPLTVTVDVPDAINREDRGDWQAFETTQGHEAVELYATGTYSTYRLVIVCGEHGVYPAIVMPGRRVVDQASMHFAFGGEHVQERWVGGEWEELGETISVVLPLVGSSAHPNDFSYWSRTYTHPSRFLEELREVERGPVVVYASTEMITFDVTGIRFLFESLSCWAEG